MGKPAIASDMAVTETWTPSRRLQAAALAERERLERELARLAAREHELTAELASIQAVRAELDDRRLALNQFAYAAAPARIASGTATRPLRAVPDAKRATAAATVLRGAAIRETAVRVLAVFSEPEAPVHYRDWFELLIAQGFMPAGKDPLATFLTQIGRSPLVQRSTASGMYVLDLDYARRARERVIALNADLADAQDLPANATVDQIAAARERRSRLTAELQETEKRLEEALR